MVTSYAGECYFSLFEINPRAAIRANVIANSTKNHFIYPGAVNVDDRDK